MATGGTICLTVRGGKSINIDNSSQFGTQIKSLVFFGFYRFHKQKRCLLEFRSSFEFAFDQLEFIFEWISELGLERTLENYECK